MRVKATYSFTGEADVELSFNENEELEVIDQNVGNGWWSARNAQGKVGIIPKAYVEEIKNTDDTNSRTSEDVKSSFASGDYGNITSNTQDETMQDKESEYGNIVAATQRLSTEENTQYSKGVIEDSSPDPYTRRWSIPDNQVGAANSMLSVNEQAPQHPLLSNVHQGDSDFDDDTEESYSTLSLCEELPKQNARCPASLSCQNRPASAVVQFPRTSGTDDIYPVYNIREQAQSTLSQRSRSNTIRTKLFDNKGIENFLLHGSRISVNESDICVVKRNDFGLFEWEPRCPTITTYEITATNEGSKLGGLKQFTVYYIAPKEGSSQRHGVHRRFKQFDWLHAILVDKFRLLCLPGLPEKFVTGRFEPELIEARKYQLQLWVNRIASHPVLRSCPAVIQFLNQDLNYSSNMSIKEWKRYKRDTENDPLRGSNWFSCIRNTSTVSFTEADTKMDAFCSFLAHFERANMTVSAQGVKFSDFHAVVGKEYSRFAQCFSELGKTFYADCHRYDCKELSSAILSIGKTYHSIAQKLSQPAGVQNLLYSIREYSTMISSFSNPINIQRSLRDTINNMRMSDQTKIPPDVVKRAASINSACLAEVNNFDKERKNDYKTVLREFIRSQRDLFKEIVAELEELETKFA